MAEMNLEMMEIYEVMHGTSTSQQDVLVPNRAGNNVGLNTISQTAEPSREVLTPNIMSVYLVVSLFAWKLVVSKRGLCHHATK